MNSFLTEIINNIDQREEVFGYFNNFKENSLYKILDLKFRYVFKNEGNISVKRSEKCYSPFFSIIENKKNYTKLIYKRVENYSKLNDLERDIVNLHNKQYNKQEIRQFIATKHEISFEEAEDRIKDALTKMVLSTVKGDVNIREIRNNPGFVVEISQNDAYYIVDIINITNFMYLPFIDIFLNNFMMVSQNIIIDDDVREFCKQTSFQQEDILLNMYGVDGENDEERVLSNRNDDSNISKQNYDAYDSDDDQFDINALNNLINDNEIGQYGENDLDFNRNDYEEEIQQTTEEVIKPSLAMSSVQSEANNSPSQTEENQQLTEEAINPSPAMSSAQSEVNNSVSQTQEPNEEQLIHHQNVLCSK